MKKAVKKYKYKIIFVIAAALMIAVIFALFSVDGAANQKNTLRRTFRISPYPKT